MKKTLFATALLSLIAAPVFAQDENMATEENTAKVAEMLAKIGCKPGEPGVEKERENLYEVDDAECGIGQYDIKLDETFTITSMTLD